MAETINSSLSDVEDGHRTVTSRARWNAMSTGQRDRLRTFLLADSYAFTCIVCGHADLVPELHMPLSYMVCGLAGKLAHSLSQSGFDSYVIGKIRQELQEREIDWRTPEGLAQLSTQLDFVNERWFRGSFKSSVCTHGGTLFIATNDPNETIKITHAVDEPAWEMCGQIAKTVLSGTYRDLFPERIPTGDLTKLVTMKKITLGGRNISHPQTTIQANGYTTKDTGAHYSTFIFDDLVVGGPGGNATPTELPKVLAHLKGLPGYYMNNRRIRRVHVGTKWDENDDDAFLTRGPRAKECITVRVPVEVYEQPPESVLVRGTPTVPQLMDTPMITARLNSTLDSEAGDGAVEFRANYWLDVSAGGGRMFSHQLLYDKERAYERMEVPDLARKGDPFPYFLRRYKRDEEGAKLAKPKWEGIEDDPRKWQRLIFDPFRDFDRVICVDPSWADGGDNWAVTASGNDYENVRTQLETRTGNDGMDGWIDALYEMVPFWRPRVIGFDAGAFQEEAIKRIIKLDKRMRRISHLFVPVRHRQISKKARIRNFVAEPLTMYRMLLAPLVALGKDEDYGAAVTRVEAERYKGDNAAVDGIVDSLAMGQAVHVKRASPDERQQRREAADARRRAMAAMIEPATGVPYAA